MVLTPEQRLDKNGRLVTRHVRSTPAATTATVMPAPTLRAAPAKERKAKTVQNEHKGIEMRASLDRRLRDICRAESRVYSIARFTCSDAEAYDVLSVTGNPANALCLLAAGIRTQQHARKFLAKNGLTDLAADNSEVVDECISRGLPAIPVLLSLADFHLSLRDRWPAYYDAVEAQSVRALRDKTNIPHLVLTGQVSLQDVRTVGATRIAEAESRFLAVQDQLKAIHEGVSPYDAKTLKQLIMLSEGGYYNSFINPLHMADMYGADFVLGLHDYDTATEFHNKLNTISGTTYDRAAKAELIKLNDDVMVRRKRGMRPEDLCVLYDAGVSADEIADGLDREMTVQQIIAVKEGVSASVSSGWL